MKPKISVLTCSNRPGGVDVTWYSLKRQTFRDFEWVFYDALYEKRQKEVAGFTKHDPRVKHYKQSPKDPQAKTWLAHAENGAIKRAQGELIVFLQDFIYIQPDALEKFWIQYQSNGKHFVTGVGGQYDNPGVNDIADPDGTFTVFDKPFRDVPMNKVWQDPRQRTDLGSFYQCYPPDWEMNFCMCPKQMLYDIGGIDESYDFIGFAFDNCSVAERASMLGYIPFIDQTNESFSINSDAWSKSAAKTDENFINIATHHANKMHQIRSGNNSVKLKYL